MDDLSLDNQKALFRKQGYLHLRSVLDVTTVRDLLEDARRVFGIQCTRFCQSDSLAPGVDAMLASDSDMFSLFERDGEVFQNCGKQVQHLISLHRLALSEKLIRIVSVLGLRFPNICTRPVLFFNHPDIAKREVYWKVFPHQDWRSMQGSANSLVIWVPLVPMHRENGALEIVPGSHLHGLRSHRLIDGFGEVEGYSDGEFISVGADVGDLLVFSAFLVHRSGTNTSQNIRWSCHFRYNDLTDNSFVERGYPHPYIYRPVEELLTLGRPDLDDLQKIYGEVEERGD